MQNDDMVIFVLRSFRKVRFSGRWRIDSSFIVLLVSPFNTYLCFYFVHTIKCVIVTLSHSESPKVFVCLFQSHVDIHYKQIYTYNKINNINPFYTEL